MRFLTHKHTASRCPKASRDDDVARCPVRSRQLRCYLVAISYLDPALSSFISVRWSVRIQHAHNSDSMASLFRTMSDILLLSRDTPNSWMDFFERIDVQIVFRKLSINDNKYKSKYACFIIFSYLCLESTGK